MKCCLISWHCFFYCCYHPYKQAVSIGLLVSRDFSRSLVHQNLCLANAGVSQYCLSKQTDAFNALCRKMCPLSFNWQRKSTIIFGRQWCYKTKILSHFSTQLITEYHTMKLSCSVNPQTFSKIDSTSGFWSS